MKRILLAIGIAVVVLGVWSAHHKPSPQPGASTSTMQDYARDFGQFASQGLPPGVECMWADITPDGHVTEYPAKDGATIAVPNGTPHPYVAKCVNGSLTAQPGSGDMPS